MKEREREKERAVERCESSEQSAGETTKTERKEELLQLLAEISLFFFFFYFWYSTLGTRSIYKHLLSLDIRVFLKHIRTTSIHKVKLCPL